MNSLLTKSVVQIVGDTLKHFSAIIVAHEEESDDPATPGHKRRVSFKDQMPVMRKSELRKYNFDVLN